MLKYNDFKLDIQKISYEHPPTTWDTGTEFISFHQPCEED